MGYSIKKTKKQLFESRNGIWWVAASHADEELASLLSLSLW